MTSIEKRLPVAGVADAQPKDELARLLAEQQRDSDLMRRLSKNMVDGEDKLSPVDAWRARTVVDAAKVDVAISPSIAR